MTNRNLDITLSVLDDRLYPTDILDPTYFRFASFVSYLFTLQPFFRLQGWTTRTNEPASRSHSVLLSLLPDLSNFSCKLLYMSSTLTFNDTYLMPNSFSALAPLWMLVLARISAPLPGWPTGTLGILSPGKSWMMSTEGGWKSSVVTD
jgi:hypothetical protein